MAVGLELSALGCVLDTFEKELGLLVGVCGDLTAMAPDGEGAFHGGTTFPVAWPTVDLGESPYFGEALGESITRACWGDDLGDPIVLCWLLVSSTLLWRGDGLAVAAAAVSVRGDKLAYSSDGGGWLDRTGSSCRGDSLAALCAMDS